mmetsp:Transcript_63871/g.101516  ORF Transcript_63871/g.101516 Transcript_63871/m.101516 type:complete len:214 (-) Transcript_63871:195-836(-)
MVLLQFFFDFLRVARIGVDGQRLDDIPAVGPLSRQGCAVQGQRLCLEALQPSTAEFQIQWRCRVSVTIVHRTRGLRHGGGGQARQGGTRYPRHLRKEVHQLLPLLSCLGWVEEFGKASTGGRSILVLPAAEGADGTLAGTGRAVLIRLVVAHDILAAQIEEIEILGHFGTPNHWREASLGLRSHLWVQVAHVHFRCITPVPPKVDDARIHRAL